MALLDDVDNELGRNLLETLVQVRDDDLDHGCDAPDPLTVVATSRGRLLAEVDRADQVTLPTPFVDNYRDLNGRAQRWWLRCRLRDLTVDEVYPMVTALALGQDDDHRLAAMVHQLTGGHPGATRIVLDAIAAMPGQWHSLAEVLHAEYAGAIVEERLLRLLLDGVPDEVVEDLVTCSPARTRRRAIELAVKHEDLFAASQLAGVELRALSMWAAQDEPRPTVLRRLLLRRLAVRGDGAATWSAVHSRLRERSRLDRQAAREPGALVSALADELAYALADGDIEFVARELDQRLGDPVKTWLALLESTTSVPGRLDPYADSIAQARRLTGWVDPSDRRLACVAGLVARLWIAADPFRDSSRRALHRQIARDYDDLALHQPAWDDELQAQKNRHQQLARMWGTARQHREETQ